MIFEQFFDKTSSTYTYLIPSGRGRGGEHRAQRPSPQETGKSASQNRAIGMHGVRKLCGAARDLWAASRSKCHRAGRQLLPPSGGACGGRGRGAARAGAALGRRHGVLPFTKGGGGLRAGRRERPVGAL